MVKHEGETGKTEPEIDKEKIDDMEREKGEKRTGMHHV